MQQNYLNYKSTVKKENTKIKNLNIIKNYNGVLMILK